jgi:hypothetical protein
MGYKVSKLAVSFIIIIIIIIIICQIYAGCL